MQDGISPQLRAIIDAIPEDFASPEALDAWDGIRRYIAQATQL